LILDIDPINKPIALLCQPYITQDNNNLPIVQQFNVDQQLLNNIKLCNGEIQVQIRCCRLDGIPLEHNWPKYGHIKFNKKVI